MPSIVAYVHAYVPEHNAGAETTLHDLLKALVASGWEASVVLSRPSAVTRPYTLDGVTVYPYAGKRQPIYAIKDADAVITHLECSERAALLGKQFHTPIIQLVHNSFWQTAGYLSVGTDLAVYNSDWIKEHHESKLREDVVKVATRSRFGGITRPQTSRVAWKNRYAYGWPGVVVHPAVDPKEYAVKAKDRTNEFDVAAVNLFASKGGEMFWELARRMPNYQFLAVKGGYGDQVIYDGFDNVTIIDNTPHIRDEVYKRSRVMIMPSQYESFGRVALEAAASSIPTVASGTPGLRECLGPNGVYADPEDASTWVLALKNLLEDGQEYAKASKYALSRSKHFNNVRPRELAEFVNAVNLVVFEGKEDGSYNDV